MSAEGMTTVTRDLVAASWRRTCYIVTPLTFALMSAPTLAIDYTGPYWRRAVACAAIAILGSVAGLSSAALLQPKILRRLITAKYECGEVA